MAPSFFSKLVKTAPSSSSHSRERSFEDTSNSTSTTSSLNKPSRSRTVSAVDAPPIVRANELGVLNANRPPALNGGSKSRVVSNSGGGGDRGYQSDTGTTSSANPSVHIVPPSPRVTEGSPSIGGSSPGRGATGLPEVSREEENRSAGNAVDGLPSSSSAASGFSAVFQRQPQSRPSSRPPSPTPTTNGSSKKLSKSRPTTPMSSQAATAAPSDAPPLPQSTVATNSSNLQTPQEVRNKSSNKSLRSMTVKITPPSAPQNPTHTPKVNSMDSSNSKTSSGGHGIVESPTSMETEFFVPDGRGRRDEDLTPRPDAAPSSSPHDTQTSPHQRSKSTSSADATFSSRPAGHRKEATAGVFAPTRQGSGWRKPTSKPTGLAGAIAASGLAMANPGMTGIGLQGPQLSPPANRQVRVKFHLRVRIFLRFSWFHKQPCDFPFISCDIGESNVVSFIPTCPSGLRNLSPSLHPHDYIFDSLPCVPFASCGFVDSARLSRPSFCSDRNRFSPFRVGLITT
ncbi:hypothetical protein L218DRAFT_669418 [Marasmius fiardii PR-910]|nr:hypothetical protein L218DRAFT_669418 [Marasmius fiardii PR-910]